MRVLQQNWLLGTCVVAAIVFCETGLVVLPFLPGDSLLFATGAFLAKAGVSPVAPMLIIVVAAIAGDFANYWIGRSAFGKSIVRKQWLKERHLTQTRHWFDRYGGRTIAIGRFVPVVRTLAPFLAGLSAMKPVRFIAYNIAGAILWGSGLLLAGFALGRVHWISAHLEWFSLAIIVVSLVPVGIQLLSARRNQREAARASLAGRG